MTTVHKRVFRILEEERVSPTARLNLGYAILSSAESARLETDATGTPEAIDNILAKLALLTGEPSVDDHITVIFCDTRVVDTLSYAKPTELVKAIKTDGGVEELMTDAREAHSEEADNNVCTSVLFSSVASRNPRVEDLRKQLATLMARMYAPLVPEFAVDTMEVTE